ncbi:MAG: serine hydrolase domain-containing protein [Halioglobus sp.]
MNALRAYRDRIASRIFRTIEVPADLESIIDIDYASEVIDPAVLGLDEKAREVIWDACQELYRSGVYPMLSLCVRRQGEVLLNRSIGYSREDTVASINTPVCLFSASKGVTAILIHLLAEQGKINLLDPISYYIPAFSARGKGSISILQMLAHRGGVASVPEGVELELLFDHREALDMICAAEPVDHQGRVQAYHAITSGFIFDELIRVTTGLTARQFLQRYISGPMKMRYFRYGLSARDRKLSATNTITGLDSRLVNNGLTDILGAHPDQVVAMTNDPRFFDAVIPSANLYGTAEEVSRFYQMLLNHGEWQGRQILQPLTVHRATRSTGKTEIDKSLRLPMRYSAGFMLGGNPVGIYGKDTQYAYGHLGYANILSWADPERDIAVSVMNTGKLALGPHLKALPALINAISTQCEPIVDMDSDTPVYHRTGT